MKKILFLFLIVTGPLSFGSISAATSTVGPQGPAGPKGATGATGPRGPIGLTGPAGKNGINGATGPQGPAGGNTIWNGTNSPEANIGKNGDFFLNSATKSLYGPKTANGWGSPTLLVGPQGTQGIQGPQGIAGTNGNDGATGPQGIQGEPGLFVPGPPGPIGPAGLVGARGEKGDAGIAGASVNLQVMNGFIQWQHEGDSSWQNLIALANITGPPASNTFGSGNNTFSLSFVTIGNPGNPNDTKTSYGGVPYGGVPYSYQMGVYDISQNQINNAVALGLPGMPQGDFTGDLPAIPISWFQAAAFVNWLNTNQGYEPAYNLSYSSNNGYSMDLWPAAQAWTAGGTNLYRNINCCYFLPSENEWYKAAYYDPSKNGGAGGYWLYSTGADSAPGAVANGTNAGTAVYNENQYDTLFNMIIKPISSPVAVTSSGGLSPYGTMGQCGNVYQWMESAYSGVNSDPALTRAYRGGDWSATAYRLPSTFRLVCYPNKPYPTIGFRVARILP